MNILWFHCTYIKPSWKIAFYILTQSEILSLLYAQCNISREYKTVLWLPLMSIKAKLNYAINFRVKSCDKSDSYLVSSFAVGLYLQHSRLWKVASIQLLAGAWKRQPQFYFTISNNYANYYELPLSCIIFRSIHPRTLLYCFN